MSTETEIAWDSLDYYYDSEAPHYHPCRPYDRARKHLNSYPCFDSPNVPEHQHSGYGEICRDCQKEMGREV